MSKIKENEMTAQVQSTPGNDLNTKADPDWKPFYKLGGVSALMMIAIIIKADGVFYHRAAAS